MPEQKPIRIRSTVFLRRGREGLEQLLEVEPGGFAPESLALHFGGRDCLLAPLPGGKWGAFIPELKKTGEYPVALKKGPDTLARMNAALVKPRHWTVHVVQLSHHDMGYTNLPSLVRKEHMEWLRQALDYADETAGYPDDARFRIVAEQAWSVLDFLDKASKKDAKRLISAMRRGDIELTALFGNMTTELCGHEELYRCLYPSLQLGKRCGIPVLSAEHNDIPGFSWGLARALADAGVKILCPGLPYYHRWVYDNVNLPSFWDEGKLFAHEGPGAFWWEAPGGGRVLFYTNRAGCGGDCHPSMPGLVPRLMELEEAGYPYDVLRWPVNGAARDNSPYIPDYAHAAKAWNEQWAWPRLICSTDARFYDDFIWQVPRDLPSFRGELPGQDYPCGAASTAEATAANRRSRSFAPAAEAMAATAELFTGAAYPAKTLENAWDDILRFHEHAWGYQFPAGPAARAALGEKALHAFRAEALLHDAACKAMASVADSIGFPGEGCHVVVFNPTDRALTAPVRAPLRELDNCGSMICRLPPEEDWAREGCLWGALLPGRWHDNPPFELVTGGCGVADAETGARLPSDFVEIASPMDTAKFAAGRLGLGSGTGRIDFYREPLGLKRDVVFVAEDVPPFGYRSYTLVPEPRAPLAPQSAATIENEYYRVSFDPQTGLVASLFDKEEDRELAGSSDGLGFLDIVSRAPGGNADAFRPFGPPQAVVGRAHAQLFVEGSLAGHPHVRKSVALYTGIRRVHMDVKFIKDSTPLLDVHVAFPFSLSNPKFLYDGPLCAVDPPADFLPGASGEALAAHGGVLISENGYDMVWSSPSAPVVSLSKLSDGYVSPAHRCAFGKDRRYEPASERGYPNAAIFSSVFQNNFGTNFHVTQPGEASFSYCVTTGRNLGEEALHAEAARALLPPRTIMTVRGKGRPGGALPPKGGLLDVRGARVLAFAKARDGRGYLLRLWRGDEGSASASFARPVREAFLTDIAENDIARLEPCGNEILLESAPGPVVSARVVFKI
jgi:hypothetical protein